MANLSRELLENKPESKSFLATALAWQGSVTPRVAHRVLVAAIYATFAYWLANAVVELRLPITPFEYSGAVLALLLVLRVNAGHDRWWEARKLWGSIVNQSRNLAIASLGYGDRTGESSLAIKVAQWAAAWPHVMRASLRGERLIPEIVPLIGVKAFEKLSKHAHMPTHVGLSIAQMLHKMRDHGFDSFAFHRAETERSALIDAIGACERIKNTRMPLVLAIKTRRFILLFLALLPFALFEKVGMLTPLVTALAAYPLLSLDEIGAELQNPFSSKNLSHLPLDSICANIASNITSLIGEVVVQSQDQAHSQALNGKDHFTKIPNSTASSTIARPIDELPSMYANSRGV